MEGEDFILLRPREFNETNLVIGSPVKPRPPLFRFSISYKGIDGKKKLLFSYPKQKLYGNGECLQDKQLLIDTLKQGKTVDRC